MRVIDTRSGHEMRLGDTVSYPDGEYVKLLDVDEGLLSANAVVEYVYRDFSKPERPLVRAQRQIPLTVRFTHPSFFLQKVAFIPS